MTHNPLFDGPPINRRVPEADAIDQTGVPYSTRNLPPTPEPTPPPKRQPRTPQPAHRNMIHLDDQADAYLMKITVAALIDRATKVNRSAVVRLALHELQSRYTADQIVGMLQ